MLVRSGYVRDHRTALLGALSTFLLAAPALASFGVVDVAHGFRLSHSSAAIDSSGRLLVAFGEGNIWFGESDGTSFQLNVVDDSADCLIFPDLAVAPSGIRGVAYFDRDADVVRYARGTGSSWTWETVGPSTAAPPNLAFDPASQPHLAYIASATLVHAVRTGAGWAIQPLPTTSQAQGFSLALDGQGQPAIAVRVSGAGVRLLHYDGSAWNTDVVDPLSDAGNLLTLAFDRAGEPAVVYYSAGELMLARRAASVWTTELVQTNPGGPSRLSLAFDLAGEPVIAYGSNNDVRLTRHGAGGWNNVVVSAASRTPSMVLDAAGAARLTFIRNSAEPLQWAEELPSVGFDIGTVTQSQVVSGSDLAVTGAVIDVVYDRAGALRWRNWDGNEWRDTPVAPGSFPSIAHGPGTTLSVAYWEPAANELRHARWTGSAWDDSVVAANVIAISNLAVDSGGDPAIVYEIGSISEVQFARRIGAGPWTVEAIDGASTNTQRDGSVAFDPAGLAAVAYTEFSVGVRYAERLGPGVWDIVTIDPGTTGGASLAFDAAGNPHIAYYDAILRRLKYATRSGTAWTTETVSDGTPGLSLALTSAGRPVIASTDAARRDLLLARRESPGVWKVELVDVPQSGSGLLRFGPGDTPVILHGRSECGSYTAATLALAIGCGFAGVRTDPLFVTKEDAWRNVRLQWGGFVASSYAVWFVRAKSDLPLAVGGGGPAEALPASPTILPSARHLGQVAGAADTIFFYDLEGRCDSGACCASTGLCRDVAFPARCTSTGDSYLGDGSICQLTPACTVPRGACCSYLGDPFICGPKTQAECDTLGGIYQGDGSSCGCIPPSRPGANCGNLLPEGACCHRVTQACLGEMTENDCTNCLGGDYRGHGTMCQGNCQ